MNRILNIIIALVAVLSGYCTATAQGDAPLVREGVKWIYVNPLITGSQLPKKYLLYFQGTETINGQEYKICYQQYCDSAASTRQKIALLRQDGDKVYLYRSKTDLSTYPCPSSIDYNSLKECEILIYDFSLNTGQSWKMMADYPDDIELDFAGRSNKKEVDSVKYIQIQGVDTKVQYIHSIVKNTTEVINGIGCTIDKLFPFPYLGVFPLSFYNPPRLLSFEDMNGNVLWKNNLGVSSVEENDATMMMEDDLLSVTAEGSWTVTVYGSDGRKVMQRKGYGSDAIVLDGLGTGIYIARLQTASAAKTLKLIR